MNHLTRAIYLCVYTLVALGAVPQALAQPTREISVTITAHTHDGQPLADIPIQLLNTPDRPAGKTDANGLLTLAATVPTDTMKVTAWVFGGGGKAFESDESLRLIHRMKLLVEGVCIERYNDVPLLPGVDAYQSEVIAWPGVSVSGVVEEAGTGPVAGTLIQSDGPMWPALAVQDGSFTLRGLRQGEPALLYVSSRWAMHVFDLSAENAVEGFDLGNIVVPPVPTVSGTMSGTMTGVDKWRQLDERGTGSPGFALVAADGSYVYDIRPFRRTSEDPIEYAIEYTPQNAPYWAPVGEFYIVPGYMTHSREVTALIKALRSGQDLTASAIPRVTIQAGQNTELTVNLAEALLALRTAVTVESD